MQAFYLPFISRACGQLDVVWKARSQIKVFSLVKRCLKTEDISVSLSIIYFQKRFEVALVIYKIVKLLDRETEIRNYMQSVSV